MGQEPAEVREEIEQTRAEMGETVDALAHKADVKGRVKESITEKRDRLRAQMSGTGERVSDATPDGEDVKQTAQKAAGIAQENPLGLALGGVALGFLAGLALPTTKIEDERIGPVSDELKEKAKETGEEALERGKEVAQQAAQSASETAREAGQEQAQELRSSVEEQAQSVQETAQEQAPSADGDASEVEGRGAPANVAPPPPAGGRTS